MIEDKRDQPDSGDPLETPPLVSLTLWPHRSLSMGGFRLLMAVAAIGCAIPLFAIIGTNAVWVVGAFVAIDLALLYGLMRLTYRSGRLRETVRLWPDRLEVVRTEPNGRRRRWEANPHWVRVRLVDTRRIEAYLVLSSAGRDIELGAFLTPDERRALADALQTALADAARRPV